jgi:hypothetical protein
MTTDKRLHSWEAAAAILQIEGRLHINRLSELVVDSAITTLGLRGDTPVQSLGPQLRNRSDIFHWDEGMYDVWETAPELASPRIAEAQVRYLDFKREQESLRARDRALHEQLQKLMKLTTPPAS